MSDIKLIAGLSNPGSSYSATRHNAGVWFVKMLASSFGANFADDKTCKAEIATFSYSAQEFKLLIPKVYMNVNGAEISKYMRYFKLVPENLLVVHDELDFEPGTIRYKIGGGCAGHNGLKSIKSHLGSANFSRLRIGIGHPGNRDDVSNFVLAKPPLSERELIDKAIETVLDKFTLVLKGEMQEFMQLLHS